MAKKYLYTSESVTEGHPDKMSDQISDSVLDAIYAKDPSARVACETAVNTGLVLVFGEITTNAYVDIPSIVRNAVKNIGYDNANYGFDCNTCAVLVSLDEQSPDIAMGVDDALEQRGESSEDKYAKIGAGDQGMMYGFACDETPELMPAPIMFSHKLCRKLAEVRKSGKLDFLRPDGKSQVTVEYDGYKPVRIETVVISTQHSAEISLEDLRAQVIEHVIKPTLPIELIDENTKYFVNPTGRFVIGGPQGDGGLTGRKIIVDTYGGVGRHGGGAFSGKDPTKVDRSAAYYARYIAKNIVASGLASRCEVQLAYAIGVANPVSVLVETFGTAKVSEELIEKLINEHFDMRPAAIIDQLQLRRPIFTQTAAYGHFGRTEKDFTWENTDKAEILKKAAAQA